MSQEPKKKSGFSPSSFVALLERRGGAAFLGFVLMALSSGMLKFGPYQISLASETPEWMQQSFMVFGALVMLLGIYAIVHEHLKGAVWLFPLITICWLVFTGLVGAGVIDTSPTHPITGWGYDGETKTAVIAVNQTEMKRHNNHQLWMFVRGDDNHVDAYEDSQIDVGGPWVVQVADGPRRITTPTPKTSSKVADGEKVHIYLGCIRANRSPGSFSTIKEFVAAGGEIIGLRWERA